MASWRGSPQIVLIDELAHSNIEGSKHRKRYEDVLDVLAANIDVLATMNVQHIESVAPTVQSVTGGFRSARPFRIGWCNARTRSLWPI